MKKRKKMLKSIVFSCLLVPAFIQKVEASQGSVSSSEATTKKGVTEIDLDQLARIRSELNAELSASKIAENAQLQLGNHEKQELQDLITNSLQQEEAAKIAASSLERNYHLQTKAKDLLGNSPQGCSTCRDSDFLKEIKPEKLKEKGKEQKLLVFVSSSMSDESLRALFLQAQSMRVSLVFRGLIENSFQQTKAFFERAKINGEIDPTLFEEYKITHVPTFVLIEGDKHDSVQGNISLEEALRTIKEKGELKEQAAQFLKRNDK
jgi:type-F conjugative transfer system pilin assembly protein TrbC